MTNAIITQQEFVTATAADWRQNVRQGLETAGFSFVRDSSEELVMTKEISPGSTFSDINFKVSVDFNEATLEKWESGDGTGSDPNNAVQSQSLIVSFGGARPRAGGQTIYSVLHPEVSGVIVFGDANNSTGAAITNTYLFSILYFKPLTSQAYWSENSYLFAFVANFSHQANVSNGVASDAEHIFQPASSSFPIGASGTLYLNRGSQIIDANPADNSRIVKPETAIVSTTGGAIAKFSDDVACVAGAGKPIGSTVSTPTGTYAIIEPEYTLNPKSRMAVRIA